MKRLVFIKSSLSLVDEWFLPALLLSLLKQVSPQKDKPMPVYYIASYDIHNEAGYQDYLNGVVPLLQKNNAEILVADYDPTTIEGQACGVNVVLRFESEEAARNWYDDPDYQPVKQIRFDTTKNGTALLANEFVPPK